MQVFHSHPEEFWLAVPEVPQKGSSIIRNFPLKWAVTFSLMYYARPQGTAYGLLYEGGRTYSEPVPEYDSYFGITSTGRPWMSSYPEILSGQRLAFQAGPRLVENGSTISRSQLIATIDVSFPGLRPNDVTQRSALGITPEGNIIYYANQSTLYDMVDWLDGAVIQEAMALDGGSSVLVMAPPDQIVFGGQSWNIPCMGVMTKVLHVEEEDVPPTVVEGPVNYQATKNFRYQEFRCPHCLTVKFTDGFHELLWRLQILRERLNNPVIVTSGYRCPIYNAQVRGVQHSQHLFPVDDGAAADIRSPRHTPEQIAAVAETVGFRGIGIYRTFTHVDTRKNPARWAG